MSRSTARWIAARSSIACHRPRRRPMQTAIERESRIPRDISSADHIPATICWESNQGFTPAWRRFAARASTCRRFHVENPQTRSARSLGDDYVSLGLGSTNRSRMPGLYRKQSTSKTRRGTSLRPRLEGASTANVPVLSLALLCRVPNCLWSCM